MKNIYLAALFIGLYSTICFAQNGLPKGFAPFEKEMMGEYLQTRSAASSGITTPPNFDVRTMAEWEEIQSLVITWTSYNQILREIVRHAKEECEVIIICSNPNSVQNYLNNGGVDMTNVTLLVEDYDTVWMRDYGGNTVYSEDLDELVMVDWIYNRPRPDDDLVPEAVAALKGIPLYATTTAPYDLVNTGGNFMSDGFGTGFASKLVLDENDGTGDSNIFYPTHSEAEVDNIMQEFMGIDRYIKMDELPYDLIHHIDMHMKLLDEETLLVGEYPPGQADGPQIEANIQYVLSNFTSMFGAPYKVIRVEMPPDADDMYPDEGSGWNTGDYRTFTNSVIVNKTILVPIYEEFYDTTALRIYEEAMPGYNVVGIDCNDIITASGALHCITKAVGVNDPLLISHQALRDTPSTSDYTVDTYIRHASGISGATLYYRTDNNTTYQSIAMIETDPANFTWSADIPGQNTGTSIYYYVEAEANSGKQQARPMTAPDGYWRFRIGGNPVANQDPNALAMTMETVFPNPANAITCIPIQSDKVLDGTISLLDIFGRNIATIHDGIIPAGESKYFFFAGRYDAGTYFVQLKTEEGALVQKVMIK